MTRLLAARSILTAVRAAAAISLSFWTPLFYITSVLPGSTSWAGRPEADPRITGSLVTPNLIVAAAFVALTITAVWLANHPTTSSAPNAARYAE